MLYDEVENLEVVEFPKIVLRHDDVIFRVMI